MPAEYPHLARGVACSLIGGALWGFSGSCSQFLLQNYALAPLTIVCLRMMGAGLLFLLVVLVRYRRQLIRLLHDARSLRGIVVFGAIGLLLDQLTYLLAIQNSNAGTATVLQCTSIVFVMMFVCATARRWPHWRELVGLLLAVARNGVHVGGLGGVHHDVGYGSRRYAGGKPCKRELMHRRCGRCCGVVCTPSLESGVMHA